LIWGPRAHRRWHYTGPAGPPPRFVKWYVRSVGAPPSETAANLVRSLWAFLTGGETAWVEEAREVEEEALAAVAEAEAEDGGGSKDGTKSRASLLMAHGIPLGSAFFEETCRAVQLLGAADEMAREVSLPAHLNGDKKAPYGYDDAAQDIDVPASEHGSEHSGSTTSSIRSAKALARYKRSVMGVGIGGTLLTWAIFAWFIFTCA
jgi:hypothetical protein